jgi:hypothetical protein
MCFEWNFFLTEWAKDSTINESGDRLGNIKSFKSYSFTQAKDSLNLYTESAS